MNGTFRLLLEKAARLHDRHETGRREGFNVFTVLRSEHDEVNLHSRFLAAVLDHRQSPGESRENLKDFLDRLSLPFIPSCLPTTARLSGTDIILSQWIL